MGLGLERWPWLLAGPNSSPKGWDGEGTKTLTWLLVPLLGLGQGFWPTRGLCSKAWGAGQCWEQSTLSEMPGAGCMAEQWGPEQDGPSLVTPSDWMDLLCP